MKYALAILLVLYCSGLCAQVDEIKTASASNSSSKSEGKSGGGESYSNDDDDDSGGNVFVNFLFGGIADWQTFKLRSDRERYPAMVSLDLMLQGGVKPSSYYMIWPRVRGNWGLFSSDFRMNYLIEEDEGGFKHIRTNDWQVLQVNLITSRFITTKLGTGFMQEAFNSKEMFSETAILFFVHAPDQTKSLNFEYRFAKDWDTGANPRREFSGFYQHQLFSSGVMHGYATIGAVYQKYYNSIEVWGVHAGVVFRLF